MAREILTAQQKEHLRAPDTWVRGLFMLLFWLIYNVVELLVMAVAIFQFISMLFTGKTNTALLQFGQGLSTFIYQMMRFFTFTSEQKPFPFSVWPAGKLDN